MKSFVEGKTFKYIVGICNQVFINEGINKRYKSWQRGGMDHPTNDKVRLWFPKMYKNEKWDNQFDETGNILNRDIIFEKSNDPSKVGPHISAWSSSKRKTRMVFARLKENVQCYTYLGDYTLDEERTAKENHLVWKKQKT